MKQTIRYGKKKFASKLPDLYSWIILDRHDSSVSDEESVITDGILEIERILKTQGLSKGARALLIIPDETRRCRLSALLPPLLDLLEKKFGAHCSGLVANGSHVLQSEASVRELVGADVFKRLPIEQHDARKGENMVDFGTTRRGTPVKLNRRLTEAEVVIPIGGVLFHYFAGFGGGPKMIFPGVAEYESIRCNHALSLDPEKDAFHPGCREGELDSNPLYQDLAEAASMVPHVISWQVLLGGNGKVRRCMAGPLLPVHREIAREAAEYYSLPITEQADMVVASAGGFPADINLIQAHKSIHHAFAAVKPGGWIVALAECSQGIGSDTFLGYFQEKSSAGIARKLRKNFKLNGQTAWALKRKTEQARIVLVSTLPHRMVESLGMIPAYNFDEALEIVRQHTRTSLRTAYFFPRASLFVPRILP